MGLERTQLTPTCISPVQGIRHPLLASMGTKHTCGAHASKAYEYKIKIKASLKKVS